MDVARRLGVAAMKWERPTGVHWAGVNREVLGAFVGLAILTLFVGRGTAQEGGYERSFPQSKATVESVLKDMQFAIAGRLPVLEGFALAGDHPLDRYQRAYFQSTVQVSAIASGGSVVRVSTKVTAWYSDSIPSRSGYQLLNSNGRLEVDLLDELAAELGRRAAGNGAQPQLASANVTSAASPSTKPVAQPQTVESGPSSSPSSSRESSVPTAPTPRLPETGRTFSSSLAQNLGAQQTGVPQTGQNPPADPERAALKAEAESLEEILKNQTHPKNLVAVKKSGTPVVASPSLTAKTLFMASAHDEFEMLDFNADWVHLRISGLSRGWVWRNSLEMPEGIPAVAAGSGAAQGAAADELFRVSREETAIFPGDWEPLRNKSVKIISVQKTDASARDGGAKLKLAFAKSLLDKSYAEREKNGDTSAGIVLIFDSADGGMIATTVGTLQQWKAGKLSDSALWHQSYFDPPETFSSDSPSASQ
jgi:hypothetical protein